MQEAVNRFTQLFDACYEDVLRYAARRVDADTARDVAAETFLIAWRKLSAVPRADEDVLPWLYGVARRVLANEHRRERRGRRLAARIAGALGMEAVVVADLSDDVTGPLGLAQALRSLSPKDQEVLQLIGWEELTVRQAAVVVGCTPASMAVRAHRARQRFLTILNDQGLLGQSHTVNPRTEGRS
ncbi:sigma-70 family RNA polymerase sigma factor [Streptosporangium sp. NPDC002524]|uniref:RNA polymerase sigma factor n=1 Tax=Streptosporangium sp. NPDC002524 TaxID=3154537 RepID=UPI0033213104